MEMPFLGLALLARCLPPFFSKQVHDNSLKLEDKLLATFPFSIENAPEGSEEITLQMLANHTSGLPGIPSNMISLMMVNQHNPYKDDTVELLESYFKDAMVLEHKPNTVNAYSNLGAGTLGYLLTKKSAMSYEDLLQQDILKPLSMSNSTTRRTEIDESQMVKCLYPDGNEVSNWDFTDALVGAGGIKSNAEDMVKFIRKNFEDDVVYNLPQKPTFSINENLEVGLGWHISTTKEGELL
jgi:CubicO group peptidase (beta-lactamase class C family)